MLSSIIICNNLLSIFSETEKSRVKERQAAINI